MRVGLDIGSTTIKCVVINDNDEIIYSSYDRHFSHIIEKAKELLQKIDTEILHGQKAILAISGSAGMGLSDRLQVPFVQEVYAERVAAKRLNPNADVIIELGGEDAKILFLTNGIEVRMNGSCAGGTGAFIDQMATLLKMSATEMDKQALLATKKYTIASRCGVFAKSDIQPLINQGAKQSDIAASIYQAVVNQTIAGLAQGRPITGNVLYLGGPLTFSTCLRNSFDATLHTQGTCPENSLLYVAIGAAYYANESFAFSTLLETLDNYHASNDFASLPPLFHNREEYWEFRNRHAKASVPRIKFDDSIKRIHIGIDSGSTTIKIAIIDDDNNLLFTDYQSNNGQPLPIVKETLSKVYAEHPHVQVASVTTTGYGEQLMKQALHADCSIVETVAHFTAAKYFMPNVDFIIDIGGQDMKCFKIKDGAIHDIFLNEACSSGCGSFLQTFAQALGYNIEDFAKLALFAKNPVDLGSRCTVFMNSSVKQAQKDGAEIDCISAGLAISVVKNALYKVIRCSSPDQLGKNIVVQGGTFYNEAVLRAFEKEMGVDVIRPDIAGLMGAYGAALYGKQHTDATHVSSTLTKQQLDALQMQTQSVQCQLCGNHCQLTINTFTDKTRLISGNRCERPVSGKASDDSLNLYAYKLKSILQFQSITQDTSKPTIAIPLVLNMYELLPFWHTFFKELGFNIIVSKPSTRAMYQLGQATIPSDTACYPAKLTHGHIITLLKQHPDYIFYPCMSYNVDEHLGDNHYNCPIVAYYPETLKDNIQMQDTTFLDPFLNISNEKTFTKKCIAFMKETFGYKNTHQIKKAIEKAYAMYHSHMLDIQHKADEMIQEARKQHKHIIVLSGRPYHIDPEVNHGVDKLIVKQNACVITEDSIAHLTKKFSTEILNQWTYHSRLYTAAKYCTTQSDTDLIQLVSFGCGLDAITTDETSRILQKGNKLYTELKIDEITNLGAVNIRIRSLFAALQDR